MGLRYRLRRIIRITPPIGVVRPTELAPAIGRLPEPARERASELRTRYDLSAWGRSVRPYEVGENLWMLDVLDRHLVGRAPDSGDRLDVGSKNWAYLAAQASALPGRWTGVELDAHHRYRSFQTRASVARWRLRSHPGCTFIAGDVRKITGRFGTVVWCLPFVTPGPHRKWGLPKRAFRPLEVLTHVWSLVERGGVLLVITYAGEEAVAQEALFALAAIPFESLGLIDDLLSPYGRDRVAYLAQRP